MGARPNKPHIAAQHIQQLRQFVETGLAEQCAQRKQAWVLLFRQDQSIGLERRDDHCSKLENYKFIAVVALSFLSEEGRPLTEQGYQCGDSEQYGRTEDQEQQGKCPILNVLQYP